MEEGASMEPIHAALFFLIVHAALGGFDTFVNHEWRERLPRRPAAATELALHAARSLMFAVIFAGSAWFEWHGAWGWAMLAFMAAEFAVTLVDSVVEDRTRRLSALERVNHMLLALNTGVYMTCFAAQIVTRWHALPTALTAAEHPPWLAWPLTAAALGVLVWTARDALASQGLVAAAVTRGRDLADLNRPA
jgi:hypothetical protein